LLTVALIEGSGIVGAGTPGLPDPFVVFMCNGKKKTSSVKFQASEPKWNGKFVFLLIFFQSCLLKRKRIHCVIWEHFHSYGLLS
jgi:Ca2+-dependent lipid-binding protein